jgi:hypothetical protein
MRLKPAKLVREPGPEPVGRKELALLNSLRIAGLLSPPLEAMDPKDFPSLEVTYQHSHDTTVALLLVPGDGLLIGMAKRMATDAQSHARGRSVAFGKAIQSRRMLHGFIGGSALNNTIRLEMRVISSGLARKFLRPGAKGPRYPANGPRKWSDFHIGLTLSEHQILSRNLFSPQCLWSPDNRAYVFDSSSPWGLTPKAVELLRKWITAYGGAPEAVAPSSFEEAIETLVSAPSPEIKAKVFVAEKPKRRPGRPQKVRVSAEKPSGVKKEDPKRETFDDKMRAFLAPSKRRGRPRKAVAPVSVPAPKPARKSKEAAKKPVVRKPRKVK